MPKEKVPVKNVGFFLVDVKRPGHSYSGKSSQTKVNLSRIPLMYRKKEKLWKGGFKRGIYFVVIIVTIIGVIGFFSLEKAKTSIAGAGSRIFENFNLSLDAFRNFDLKEARKDLEANIQELSPFAKLLNIGSPVFGIQSIVSTLPVLKDAGSVLRGVTDLNLNLIQLTDVLTDLKINGFRYFREDGKTFLDRLERSRTLLHEISLQTQLVRNSATNLKSVSSAFAKLDDVLGEEYVGHIAELQSLDTFLGALINLLSSNEERHIALLFQNPSEIRPAGGFLGSYGVISLKHGQMSNLEVQDIYWPDHAINFSAKVIPPEPLQTVTKDWGARDGNWFFDFPSSAETVLGFLEQSKIYQENGIKFDGAIALNINFLKNVIEATGPVMLTDYGLEINKDNFLIELQREVEAGRDKQPGKNPKKILGVLTPILLERIGGLSDTEKANLFDVIIKRIEKKDIMFFSRDKNIASFLEQANINGSVYSLPSSFWGSYLAVVNANIAGGKSDAFIKQNIEARFDIDSDGGALVDLSITRTHNGQDEKDPWWRATNKDFIQIFTNPGSSLGFLKGNDPAGRLSGSDYASMGYTKNAILEAIQDTKKSLPDYHAWSYDEFGKRVYATWLSIRAGETKTIEMRYELPRAEGITLALGKVYRLVFDRQSGVSGGLKIIVNAPLGYEWAESQAPIYVFEAQDPDRRIILDLTLAK